MKTKPVKELSIQISLSGLSFCIINKSENLVEFIKSIDLEHKQSPANLLARLKAVFETNSVFEQDFTNISCIYQNELSCLVPKDLFKSEHLADYLKFNAKILKTDFINYDEVKSIEAINVYVPLVNINNYLFDRFGSFTYKHSSTILIEQLISEKVTVNEKLFLNVNQSTFEILSFGADKLKFYNIFQYQTPQDLVYYLLFTIEQLNLDTEIIKLFLIGGIEKENETFKLIYKYVRNVEILEFEPHFKFEKPNDKTMATNHFIILNSFS